MPAFDATHRADLRAAIDYELYAVDEFRVRVHSQRDQEVASVSHTLGERTANGAIPLTQEITGISIGGDEVATRAALDPLRPLLFGAAFKAQDLMVEWLLRANNTNPAKTHWPFNEKRSLLPAAQQLPPEVIALPVVWKAFVETYARLIEPRNVLVHRKGVRVHANGDIELGTGATATLLSHAMQGAYARAVAIIGHSFSGTRQLDRTGEVRVEAALAELAGLHNVQGLQARSPRRTRLTIHVPPSSVRSTSPVECLVDFAEVAGAWRRLESLYTDNVMLGEIRLRPAGTEVTWIFDPENLPSGSELVREGDPAFDSYLLPPATT